MANTSTQISIDKLVRQLLFKEGKNTDDYMRYKQTLCDGLRNMHIHDFNVELTFVATVDSTTKRFSYPDDYVRYTSISTPHNGRWWSFTRDANIVPLTDDSDVAIQDSMPNIALNDFASSLSDGGGYNNYYFKEDDTNREFIVSGFDADKVVLKYISNGLNTSGEIYVPDYAALALESWTRWQMSIHNRDAISTREINRQDYKTFRLEMRKVLLPTLDEVYDIIYKSSGQGARR